MRCTDRAPQSEPCTPDPSADQPGNIKQDNYRKQGNSLLFITCSRAQGIDSREVPIIVFQMANLFLKVRSVNIFEPFKIFFLILSPTLSPRSSASPPLETLLGSGFGRTGPEEHGRGWTDGMKVLITHY